VSAAGRRRADAGHTPAPLRAAGALAAELLTLATRLRSAGTLQQALRHVARTAADVTASPQTAVRMLDANREHLLLAARRGASLHAAGKDGFRSDEGFQGWVVSHDRADLCTDPLADERFQVRPDMSWMPSALGAAPLRGQAGVIGVLTMACGDGRRYESADLRVLEVVAALAEPHLEARRLAQLAITDPLTRLPDRRAYDHQGPAAVAAARLAMRPLALILVDLDHFGDVNNHLGYEQGDLVLCEAAARIHASCREEDVLYRWGGDEFVVLLDGATRSEACAVAERVRARIAGAPFPTEGRALSISASLGVSTLRADDDLRTLKVRAGEALHRAKRERNDVAFR